MITAQWAKGNGGIYRYYRCTRKQGECHEKYIAEDLLKQKIILLDERLDKLVEGYLDNLIDENTYKRKKQELIEQKTSFKNEKESLHSKQMSGWIEPTRDFVKTLCQAEKITKEESLKEISIFVQKIGTNRLLSAKSVSWVWKPEYEFTQTLLRRFAQKQFGQNGSLRISVSPKSRSPLLCGLFKFARTYFSKTPANAHAPRAS